ncbi:hypothetical protein GCM10027343_24500 [Noviherbaspirillum agri]
MQGPQSAHDLLSDHVAVALYFGAPTCNVCHVLEPKLRAAINEEFPDMVFNAIDASAHPAIAAHFNVFTVPTLLVFFEGREAVRKSRHMAIGEVIEAIRRPYSMLKSD